MTHTPLPLTGTCLCGAVQIHITAPPLLTMVCHCRDCQKLTASDYSLTIMFPTDGFSLTGNLRRGGKRTPERTHYFCKSCLNFVYSQMSSAPERINLRLSLLDAAAVFPPFLEVMTEEKLPWSNIPAPHSYARYPTSLEELQSLMHAYGQQ